MAISPRLGLGGNSVAIIDEAKAVRQALGRLGCIHINQMTILMEALDRRPRWQDQESPAAGVAKA
jgi:hypothetical protein